MTRRDIKQTSTKAKSTTPAMHLYRQGARLLPSNEDPKVIWLPLGQTHRLGLVCLHPSAWFPLTVG